jgi:hypothetical protein
MTSDFIVQYARVNAGYKGPAVKEIPHDGERSFNGALSFELVVNMSSGSQNAIDQEWAVRAMEQRLKGTGLGVLPGAPLGKLVIDVKTFDMGYRWLTLVKGTYLRMGLVELPGGRAVYTGDVWSHTSLTNIGKLVFNVRKDVLDIFDSFVAGIKAAQ